LASVNVHYMLLQHMN